MEGEQIIKKQFKGQRGCMNINLTLAPEGNSQVLLVQMTNKQTEARVNLIISNFDVQQQDHYFTDNIESVAMLYETLITDFDHLNFTEDGTMLLEIDVLIKKKVQKKVYRFQGAKEELNPVKRLLFQFEKMMNDFKIDSQRKDQRISELQRKQAKVEEENDEAKAERQKLKKELELLRQQMNGHIHALNVKRISDCQTVSIQYTNTQERIEKNAIKIEEIKQQALRIVQIHKDQTKDLLRQIRHDTERYIEGLAAVSRTVEIHQQDINKLRKMPIEQDEKRVKPVNFKLNHENMSIQNFIVRDDTYGRFITKVANNEIYDTFVFSDPLAWGRTHTFSLKIIKTNKKFIIFGVGSQNSFGTQFTNKHKQTLSYSAYSGKVFELGSGRSGGSTIGEGQVLTMVVNLNAWYVQWAINNKFAASVAISQLLRTQPLYLFIMMANTGDMIQIL